MILAEQAKQLYSESFGKEKTRVFFSHGRLEIIGNHTDHQGGLCLVAGCDLGITAAVRPNKDGAIRMVSEGYAPFQFYLDELALRKGEKGTTIALAKGVLSRMKELGFKIGGFSAALKGDLPAGSGLSSSAAVEALLVKIIDALYNNDDIDPLLSAKIGQYAENVFFGKPCGLLDQIGCCYGNMAYVDFGDPDNVLVEPIPYNLPLKVILIHTGGSHAGLDDLYASIPSDMFSVAHNVLGVERLADATMMEFMQRVCVPNPSVSERAKLRAQHFYDECARVRSARKALIEKDPGTFIQDIRLSQESSHALLANTFVPGRYEQSPQQAVDIANKIIGHGGARIMGGGFAGSAICFVYPDDAKEFVQNMSRYYGASNVIPMTIVKGGPVEVK